MSGPQVTPRSFSGGNTVSEFSSNTNPNASVPQQSDPSLTPIQLLSSGPLSSGPLTWHGSHFAASSAGGTLSDIVSPFTDPNFQAKTVPIAELFGALTEGMDGVDINKGVAITLTYHFANKTSVDVNVTLEWKTSNMGSWISVAEPDFAAIELEVAPHAEPKWGIKLPRYYSTPDRGRPSARPGNRPSDMPTSVTVTYQNSIFPGLTTRGSSYKNRSDEHVHPQPTQTRERKEDLNDLPALLFDPIHPVRSRDTGPSRKYETLSPEEMESWSNRPASVLSVSQHLSHTVNSLSSINRPKISSTSSSSSSPMFDSKSSSHRPDLRDPPTLASSWGGPSGQAASSDRKGALRNQEAALTPVSEKNKKIQPRNIQGIHTTASAKPPPRFGQKVTKGTPQVVASRQGASAGQAHSPASSSSRSRPVPNPVPARPPTNPTVVARERDDAIHNKNKQTGDQVRSQEKLNQEQRSADNAAERNSKSRRQAASSINSPKTEKQKVVVIKAASASAVRDESEKLASEHARRKKEALAKNQEKVAAQRQKGRTTAASRGNPTANKK